MVLPHVYRPQPNGVGLYYTWFSAMHTRVDILFCSQKTEQELEAVSSHIRQYIADIELMANCFNEHSELAQVNRLAWHHEIALSAELNQILTSCLTFHQQTNGLFDITVDSEGYSPDSIHAIRIQDSHIRFLKPGIRINLSGMIKGYGLDKIHRLLKSRSIEDALVNLGNSSVMAMGNGSDGKGWQLSLQQTGEQVCLQDQCLTTSGNDSMARRHIVNPATGLFVDGKRSVAVVTSKAIEGEVLSTAMFIATSEQRQQLLTRFQVDQVIDLND